ncbi:MAG: DNA repair exonuclease [Chloroflexia bacterium]|nr:DNA repair exonuclease [Chloroflexia bacterium]
MTFRVLCTGDVHIGRRASKVAGAYRCADAWSAIIDLAIEEQVDLLAVSGDIVDKEPRSYEALGPLESGFQRLERAGIEAVAVSGNHDHDVLHALSGVADGRRLWMLGRGGTWERHTFTGADGSRLHVDGWSFPTEHVLDHPMQGYPAPASDGTPVLGLLHGEVGVANSRYAPIRLDDLWAQQVDLWLLGHIHAPKQFTSPGGVIAFYPGSPWAMDPGEPGVHGVWIAEFDASQPPRLAQRAISPVHFDRASVDLSPITGETDFMDALMYTLRIRGEDAIARHGHSLRIVSCRLHLSGRTPLHHQVVAWMQKAKQDLGPISTAGQAVIHLDDLTSDVRPAIDLAGFARGNDPAGEAARLILALDEPVLDPAYAPLVRDTRESIAAVNRHSGYATLAALDQQEQVETAAEAEIRALLSDQAWNLLAALVGKKELV